MTKRPKRKHARSWPPKGSYPHPTGGYIVPGKLTPGSPFVSPDISQPNLTRNDSPRPSSDTLRFRVGATGNGDRETIEVMNGSPDRRLTPQTFEDLASFVEDLLGDQLERHYQRYQRALSFGASDFVPHRLAWLYDRMVDARITTAQSPPSGDLPALIELHLFRSLVDEFSTDSEWIGVKQELNDKNSFAHLISMLMFLSMQRARGTRAKLNPGNQEAGPSADAILYTPAKDRIDVEVKAPDALITPREIQVAEAEKIIESTWRRAKKQLRNNPSILLIGGLFVPGRSLDRLQVAAQQLLDRKTNENVAFIRIQSISVLLENPVLDAYGLGVGSNTNVAPQLHIRDAANSSYTGVVEFNPEGEPPPGFERASPDQREVVVEGRNIVETES